MTCITDELKEQFKDFLAEQDFIYDDKETRLTEIYYWDYNLASKTHQINYYRSLKTDQERQIYATAIGQQYALDLLCSSLEEITKLYDLDFLNTFFKTIEFKLA